MYKGNARVLGEMLSDFFQNPCFFFFFAITWPLVIQIEGFQLEKNPRGKPTKYRRYKEANLTLSPLFLRLK